MNAFAAALAAIFADPNLAVDALWRVGGAGAGVPVRVTLSNPDETVAFGERAIAYEARRVELLVSAVPVLAAGDTIEIDGEVYPVINRPKRDADRLVWSADLGDPA
jgi:hypothetical protein